PDYEALATAHAQVETKFGNAKIRDGDTLLRFLLLHIGAGLPLRQTVAVMAEAGLPSLSPMRLHKKMCRAAPYLRALVERMVDWPTEGAPERWGGYVFSAVDATAVCGPGATGTDARIHTKLRIADVALTEVQVTDEHGGESLRRFAWEPGELAVGDRAYFTPPGIQHVLKCGADVLVRYRLEGVELSDGHGHIVDVLSAVSHLAIAEVFDMDVEAALPDGIAAGRLIAYRLPDDAVERARERLRREKGGPLSERVFESAKYVLLFTTASRQRLSAERCLQGYRLRWQIELQFKRWKSLCGFDLLPNQRDDTTLAWIYGKVLLGLLLDRMASIPVELSPPAQDAAVSGIPADVVRPVEDHEHPVAAGRRCASAIRAA
ncbi:MAG: transposase, partial [Deltaproteobacteria bacterium]|nr:transposase [Deltaproteobacteria bacterium]